MEKTAKEVFNEIQTTIDQLRAQLDELERRLAEERAAEAEEPAPVPVMEPEPEFEPEPEPIAVAEPEPEIEEVPVEFEAPVAEAPAEEAPVEEAPAEPETIDLSIDMQAIGAKPQPDAKNFQWMIDIPGGPVANVISGISLNDRVLFINMLFGEDPGLFQQTIAAFNSMESIGEAVSYVMANFPDWNLSSEVVYRLMMAVRRKLK